MGYGRKYPAFWLSLREGVAPPSDGAHVALRVRDPAGVDAFHAAALAHGGRCEGPPGPRQAHVTPYHGAFVFDPWGNKIEAVSFPPAD
ncbi:MAG: VOC family protein [Pseudomonadota bacterium]